MEPWKMIRTKNQVSPYYGQRDDFRQVTKEMIMNAGRGYVDNNDQPCHRQPGPELGLPDHDRHRYPKGVQEFIDIREKLADWFAPPACPSGTRPRPVRRRTSWPDTATRTTEEETTRSSPSRTARPGRNGDTRPRSDNNIYLHVIKGPDGKKGFDAIAEEALTIRPVKDRVTSVSWLNQDLPVTSFRPGQATA